MHRYPRPLRTIEDARSFFMAMGCSPFHMVREDQESNDQYHRLGVTTELERQWRYEVLELDCQALERGETGVSGSREPWSIHANIVELTEMLEEEAAVVRACAVSEPLPARLRGAERVIVAENLLGRSLPHARRGLACCAIKVGRPDLARRVLELVEQLVEQNWTGRVSSRRRSAMNLCAAFRKMLDLEA